MKKGNILIVEDDDDIRFSLKEMLEIEGYQVDIARNGREGLDVLSQLDFPCLILLDLMMPVMSGDEFLLAKNQLPEIAKIPVIIVSAVADRTRVDRPGVVQFVRKPIHMETLLRVVEEYCLQ